MRGQKKHEGEQLKRGRTIVAEREQAESESERMQARRKAHRKKTRSFVVVVLMTVALILGVYLGMKELSYEHIEVGSREATPEIEIKAEVIDEDSREISTRMREYIAQLEGDFRDLGYNVAKVTIPTGTSRELYVDLAEKEGVFFKVNLDRGTAVTAEDTARMIKYLEEKDLHPGYVDVRVAGRAYYK